MQALGQAVRSAREVAGLTQLELAKLAGVSQGAVSRLEMARGLSTPLVMVLRVLAALRTALSALPGDDVPADIRRLVEMAATGATGPTVSDQVLQRLLRIYRDLKPDERDHFIRIAEASSDAIIGTRSRSSQTGKH